MKTNKIKVGDFVKFKEEAKKNKFIDYDEYEHEVKKIIHITDTRNYIVFTSGNGAEDKWLEKCNFIEFNKAKIIKYIFLYVIQILFLIFCIYIEHEYKLNLFFYLFCFSMPFVVNYFKKKK